MKKIVDAPDNASIQNWKIPFVGGDENNPHNPAEIEDIRNSAYQEGLQQGLQAAEEQVKQQFAQITLLSQMLNQSLLRVDQEIEQELLELSIVLTQHCLRHEITQNPDLMMNAIKEMMTALPVMNRQRQLHVNAQDKQLLEQALSSQSIKLDRCELIDDDGLSQGEYRLRSDVEEIDATVRGALASIADRVLHAEKS